MTCKDCVCYETSKSSKLNFANSAEPNNICQYFKNKSNFIEVIRCGQCMYAEKHYDTTYFIGNTYFPSGVPVKLLYITCKYHKGQLAENDFCSYGKPNNSEI